MTAVRSTEQFQQQYLHSDSSGPTVWQIAVLSHAGVSTARKCMQVLCKYMHMRSICGTANSRRSSNLDSRETDGIGKTNLQRGQQQVTVRFHNTDCKHELSLQVCSHLFDMVAEFVVRQDPLKKLYVFPYFSFHVVLM